MRTPNTILANIALVLAVFLFCNNAIVLAAEHKSHHIGVKPESVIRAFDQHLFVSVMGGKSVGDGKITKIINDNLIEDFATGLDEPKGLAFINNKLYVSDINKIWEINESGEKQLFVSQNEFPSTALYLNDLDSDHRNNELYVTDMGAVSFMRDNNGNLWDLNSVEAHKIPNKGRVYAISLLNKSIRIVMDFNVDIRNPNGIAYDADEGVLISGFFSGKIINIKDKNTIFLPGTYRGADQARYDSIGNIYISSWTQGKVWKLDKTTLQVNILFEGLQSAADFIIDEQAGVLIIPDMLNGSLHYIPLEK